MSEKARKPGALCLRIILFANLIAQAAYGALTPHQMTKVTAECVTIGIVGLAMAVQIYVTLVAHLRLPYKIWVVLTLDGLCAAGWVVAIAVLSYWRRSVLYSPRPGDPKDWFKCADARYWDQVLTSDGYGHWINIAWCEVEVNGEQRLVGNGAARQQLDVLIGLSAVSLLFTGFILLWTAHRAVRLGLIASRSEGGKRHGNI
jgi:hypothetical protein